MAKTRRGRLLIVVAVGAAASARPAAGHVAPSVDDNNRYIKVTPLGDRVRLAYTVYFGEVPGARARVGMDRNHDGALDDAEADAFGRALSEQVGATFDLTLDGRAVPLRWETIDVGLGAPVTQAGSFAIDLIAWPCLDGRALHHTLIVRDRFDLPNPGETELRAEEGAGIRIDGMRLGGTAAIGRDVSFRGSGGPLRDDGWQVEFTIGPEAPRGIAGAGGQCGAGGMPAAGGEARGPRWVPIAAGGLLGVVAAAIVTWVRRRRMRARA